MNLKEIVKNFRPPAFPGSYVLSLEGIEGAGKSTQIIKCKEYLESMDFRVLVLREPGGTSFGERLRQAILSSQSPIHPVAELHLFASSRAQLLHEVTIKELAVPNTIIIYDRYIDSTLAYQGKARNLGFEAVLKSHSSFPLTLVPHLTFYLEIPAELSQARQKMRNAPKDYFEKQGDSFYDNLVQGYEEACELFPERIVRINGHQDPETVFNDMKEYLENLIQQKTQPTEN
ncbi:MAG: dTMP kinase [Halobacteriovoraceae bacterium]|nr:dTMP kinase [Halobacteriovoraceae bacterium]